MSSNRLLRVAVALALAPAAAFAQDAEPQQSGLQEIVVTAERREASLQSVPIPVTALNEEALIDRQVLESRDLERFTPSLKMLSNITSPTTATRHPKRSTVYPKKTMPKPYSLDPAP